MAPHRHLVAVVPVPSARTNSNAHAVGAHFVVPKGFAMVICAISEWRCCIEGSAKITVFTYHAALRHLLTMESLVCKRAIWLNDLSPYLALNPRTNKSILEILY
jgi:hypothetical protein